MLMPSSLYAPQVHLSWIKPQHYMSTWFLRTHTTWLGSLPLDTFGCTILSTLWDHSLLCKGLSLGISQGILKSTMKSHYSKELNGHLGPMEVHYHSDHSFWLLYKLSMMQQKEVTEDLEEEELLEFVSPALWDVSKDVLNSWTETHISMSFFLTKISVHQQKLPSN